MKVHPVNLLAAFIMSALLTYGIAVIETNVMKVAIGIGSFLFFASTLCFAVGITFNSARTGMNVKVVAIVFFIIALMLNFVWAYLALSQTSYVIIVGIAYLIYIMIANGIYRAQA